MKAIVASPLMMLAVLVAAGCGAGSAGQAVRPDEKSAGEALGEPSHGGAAGAPCTKAPAKGEPLIVDWKTTEQLDLTVAMQHGVAAVAYDCKSIKVLKDCKVKGGYGFTSIPSVLQETVTINDADEARASMPLGGASVGGEIARGSSIDIALAYVGKRSSLNELITKSDLGTGCEEATHFVRAATVGAFVMQTGTKGKVAAAAEIFGAGASTASSSDKKRLNSAGDVGACKGVKDGADKPPESCSAIIRLELVSIAGTAAQAGDPPKESSAPKPLENTCPDGFIPSGGRCARKSAGAAHRCDPNDVEDCKAQCSKGDMESCYNAGVYLQDHQKGPFAPDDLFAPMLEKACNGGIGRACGRAALFFAPGLHACCTEDKHFAFARKGCDLLDRGSCMFVADGDKSKTWTERLNAAKKACNLGNSRGCQTAAGWLLLGKEEVAKKPDEAIKLLEGSCDGGKADSCADLVDVFKKDKKSTFFSAAKKSDVPPDDKKAEAYAQKACILKKGGPSGSMPSDIRGVKCVK